MNMIHFHEKPDTEVVAIHSLPCETFYIHTDWFHVAGNISEMFKQVLKPVLFGQYFFIEYNGRFFYPLDAEIHFPSVGRFNFYFSYSFYDCRKPSWKKVGF